MANRSHEIWMARALSLAVEGKSKTQPNPMVGCVIVKDGDIISEGYHKEYGASHAEVNALTDIDAEGATAYVSLEPCSHTGKTPPCADLLIKKKVSRVYTAMEDPNPRVSGSGHQRLRENGIEVITGILEEEARELNRIFIHLQSSPLPYITLKWAESHDGFMDPDRTPIKGRGSIAISSSNSSKVVHRLRSLHNSILIGRNTLEVDNPNLTSREDSGVNPIKIVIDPNCSVEYSRLNITKGVERTIIVCNTGKTNSHSPNEGVEYCEGLESGLDHVMLKLRDMGVYSILIEGGASTLKSFISDDLWNEAYVFKSQQKLSSGLRAPELDIANFNTSKLGEDYLFHLIR